MTKQISPVIANIKSKLHLFTKSHIEFSTLVSFAEQRCDELEGLLMHLDEKGQGATDAQVKDLKRAFDAYCEAKGNASIADNSLDVLRDIDRLI